LLTKLKRARQNVNDPLYKDGDQEQEITTGRLSRADKLDARE
jgi:hypothetical protein